METNQTDGLALLLQRQARMLKKLQETVKTLKQDVEALSTVAGMYLEESRDWEKDTEYIKIMTEPRDSWGKA
tara:strand:- start:410 stop:625 length:216 start_codon:yes stop_codon:yes gene_type:complete